MARRLSHFCFIFATVYGDAITVIGQPMEEEGIYTAYDSWSPCDVICGVGIRTRYRACFPIGAVCNGSDSEKDRCQLTACPGSGKWGDWTPWTDCTKSCGVGMQTKYRLCMSNLNQCVGSNRQLRICNPQPCVAAGGWSAWNEWSSCSEKCGSGIRYQDRICEDPPPSGGGVSCHGLSTQIGHCFKKPCSDKSTLVGFFNGESFLEYEKTYIMRKLLSLYVKFKPESSDGILLYRHHGRDTSITKNDTVMLRLRGANVEMLAQYAGISSWITDSQTLETGKWHTVYAAVVGARVILRIDDAFPLEQRLGNVEMEHVDFDQEMFIGGLSRPFVAQTGIFHSGFIGEIANVRIGFEEYFLDDAEESSINEETNHPIFSNQVEISDIDSQELYPTFEGSDYTVFTCTECYEKPDYEIEIVIKSFKTSSGLIWANFGETPGSFLILHFKKSSLVLCMDLGEEQICTSTEPVPGNHWLTINVFVAGHQAKLRINHDRAHILAVDGKAYKPTGTLHFAGGELEFWTTIYLATKEISGFEGILYSISINRKDHDVRKEVVMRETGRLVSSATASVAVRYDEFHEPPVSEVDFQCDLSEHEEALGVRGGMVYWLREGEMVQNFSGTHIQKVPGKRHMTKITLRNQEISDKDGFYGCLLRTGHQELLVHVFGVSFDDANEIDILDVGENVVLIIALLGALVVLMAILMLLRSGLMRRFSAYNKIMQRMPSWFTDGHRKNFLLRHTSSLQQTGILPPDYIQRLLTMQEKAIQTPSAMDLSRLYGQPPDNIYVFGSKWNESNEDDSTNLLTVDSDLDYDKPVTRTKSGGTFFAKAIINQGGHRGPNIKMKVPEHIKKAPERYLARDSRSKAKPPSVTTTTGDQSSTSYKTTSYSATPSTSDGSSYNAHRNITTSASTESEYPVNLKSKRRTIPRSQIAVRKPPEREESNKTKGRSAPITKKKAKFLHDFAPNELGDSDEDEQEDNVVTPKPTRRRSIAEPVDLYRQHHIPRHRKDSPYPGRANEPSREAAFRSAYADAISFQEASYGTKPYQNAPQSPYAAYPNHYIVPEPVDQQRYEAHQYVQASPEFNQQQHDLYGYSGPPVMEHQHQPVEYDYDGETSHAQHNQQIFYTPPNQQYQPSPQQWTGQFAQPVRGSVSSPGETFYAPPPPREFVPQHPFSHPGSPRYYQQ